MADWISQMTPTPALDFGEMAARMHSVALPPGGGDPGAVGHMSMRDAVVVFSKRVMGDPVMRAAAERIYSESWLVRQVSSAMYDLV